MSHCLCLLGNKWKSTGYGALREALPYACEKPFLMHVRNPSLCMFYFHLNIATANDRNLLKSTAYLWNSSFEDAVVRGKLLLISKWFNLSQLLCTNLFIKFLFDNAAWGALEILISIRWWERKKIELLNSPQFPNFSCPTYELGFKSMEICKNKVTFAWYY